MTKENLEIWERINKYAEDVLKDIDPQKTKISIQLDALRPIMEEIASEKGISLEDMFIRYMDIASEAGVEANNKFNEDFQDGRSSDFSSIANTLE